MDRLSAWIDANVLLELATMLVEALQKLNDLASGGSFSGLGQHPPGSGLEDAMFVSIAAAKTQVLATGALVFLLDPMYSQIGQEIVDELGHLAPPSPTYDESEDIN